jgi:SAM-dependent methyltransferase
MPRLSVFPTFLREILLRRSLPRVPEPTMAMDGAEQVEAYASSGRADGVMAAASLFHSALVSTVIGKCGRVLDLGCGPASQLGQIAQFNPSVRFIGVELSSRMLISARNHVAELGIDNVDLRHDDITRLETVPDGSVDGVISTMTLHHLPAIVDLQNCFRQIRRVLRPGGALYLADFGRLKSEKSVHFFAHIHQDSLPPVVVEDYLHSLRAAFAAADYRRLVAEELPRTARVHTTFGLPFLVMIKSPGQPVAPDLRERVRALRRALSPRFRTDLDDLRLFFRLDGMENDPFR